MKTNLSALVYCENVFSRNILRPEVAHAWECHKKKILDSMPSGSGIDNGTKVISVQDSRVILSCEFHHMNANGYYDGWTKHNIVFYSEFCGVRVAVTGVNKNDIKEYLADVYHAWANNAAPDFTLIK